MNKAPAEATALRVAFIAVVAGVGIARCAAALDVASRTLRRAPRSALLIDDAPDEAGETLRLDALAEILTLCRGCAACPRGQTLAARSRRALTPWPRFDRPERTSRRDR